ncbi:MAG: hypothetical protein SO434_02855 [Eubacteriales bacterium]|nr:hypothetical protein [Eubacteriales bacterium]
MKKRCLIFILTAIFAIISLTTLVACENADKNDINGTYELTKWTIDYEDNVPTDIMERDEVEAYVVITGQDKGFYVYQSKSTPLYCKQVKIELEYSSTDPEKVIVVRLKDGMGWSMSFTTSKTSKDVMLKDKNLKIFDQKASLKEFTRISKATDLSAVNAKVGQTLTYVDFEYAPFDCWYEYVYETSKPEHYADVERYVYYFVKTDVKTNKAKAYYCLKSDLVQRTTTLDTSLDLAQNTFTVGADTFSISYENDDCHLSYNYAVNSGEIDQYDVTCWLSRAYVTDIDALCAERLEEYRASLE